MRDLKRRLIAPIASFVAMAGLEVGCALGDDYRDELEGAPMEAAPTDAAPATDAATGPNAAQDAAALDDPASLTQPDASAPAPAETEREAEPRAARVIRRRRSARTVPTPPPVPAPAPPPPAPLVRYAFRSLPSSATSRSWPEQTAQIVARSENYLQQILACPDRPCREQIVNRVVGPDGPDRRALFCQTADVFGNVATMIQRSCTSPALRARCAFHCAPGRYDSALARYSDITSLCPTSSPRSLLDVVRTHCPPTRSP